MALIVQKYGGTSVGDIDKIRAVAEKVSSSVKSGNRVIVVVSAMSGETNRLVKLAENFSDSKGCSLDMLLSTGEQVTISLLSMALREIALPATPLCGWQIPIKTDDSYGKARIENIEIQKIVSLTESEVIPVVAGFQGVDDSGVVTTLGRGGSDTTAVALAAAMNADECQIYTDVDGVYTTDPRIVPEARRLDCLTYEEMLEMASLGAKVLQIRAVEFASKYKVNLRVLSSFEDGDGTRITDEDNEMEKAIISGVALNKNEAQVMVVGVPDRPGIANEILGPVAQKNIEVDMIVQNSGANGATDFTFTVPRSDYEETLEILRPLAKKMDASRVEGDDKIVKISVIGVGMRSHAGIASRMFASLAKENINIKMISTSEIKISVVVEERYSELGVRALHAEFGLEST